MLVNQNPYSSSLLPTEAYMLGLLHDVGKLVLDQYFESDFERSRAYAVEHECSDAEAECATIGMDHGEIAAGLLELWNLQPALIEAVRFHHNLDASGEDDRANAELVCYADTLLHVYLRGELSDEKLIHPTLSLDEIGLNDLVQMLDQAKERAQLLVS